MLSILDKKKITDKDIQNLISAETEESINLDFKAAGSLDKSDKKKNEIAKDVSAFANSAGGFIIYGISEENHKASEVSPIDGNEYTKEWLEQVINTRVQRKIEGLTIVPVRLQNKIEKTIYIVKIPESTDAPHLTSNKKFYKRYNFESVQMEEYEIRSLYNRRDKSKLSINNIITNQHLEVETEVEGEVAYIDLSFQVENIGKTIEKDYKLLIMLSSSNYVFKFDPVRNTKNFNHSVFNNSKRIISFFGVSPIFPEEILSIGNIKLGILQSELNETIENGILEMTLLYAGGEDRLNISLKEIFKNVHNII